MSSRFPLGLAGATLRSCSMPYRFSLVTVLFLSFGYQPHHLHEIAPSFLSLEPFYSLLYFGCLAFPFRLAPRSGIPLVAYCSFHYIPLLPFWQLLGITLVPL